MIIGFGSTEIEMAQSIINKCLDAIKGKEMREIKEILEGIAKEYSDLGEEQRKLDRNACLARYTYFFHNFYNRYDGDYMITFTMHHINRNHAFSPDGWALLVTKWIATVDEDGATIYKEA